MKILVTSDFSTNSKGAIRFVQTLAKQSKEIEVIFFHAVHFAKPTRWSKDFYQEYKHNEIQRVTAEFQKFVHSVLGKDKAKFLSVKYIVHLSLYTEEDIMRYAEKNKMDFICIATQGAGVFRKMIGTHTSFIVQNAKIPVLVIPSHYRSKPIKKITYLSDFENIKKETDKVLNFSTTIKSSVHVLHYSSLVLNKNKFERSQELFTKEGYKGIKLNVIKNNLEVPMLERVSRYVAQSRPELLVMFTKKEKSFFERLFVPSKSAELTYTTKVPVLIYSK